METGTVINREKEREQAEKARHMVPFFFFLGVAKKGHATIE